METTIKESKAIELAHRTGHVVTDCERVLEAAGDDLDLAQRSLDFAATQDRSRWAQVAIASRMARNTRRTGAVAPRDAEPDTKK